MSFGADVKGWVVKVDTNSQKVVEELTDDLYTTLRERTPVDKGALRDAWKKESNGNVTTIYNDKPYMAVVEYGGYPNPPQSGTKTVGGYSTQAPQGVIGITVLEVPQRLQAAARKVGG